MNAYVLLKTIYNMRKLKMSGNFDILHFLKIRQSPIFILYQVTSMNVVLVRLVVMSMQIVQTQLGPTRVLVKQAM